MILDQVRRALAGREDVRVAFLFGSQARGTAGAASDVDLAVLAPGLDLVDLAVELTGLFRRRVDVVSLEDPSIPLLEAVIRDGIVAHEAHRGAAAAWRSFALATLDTDRPWFRRMRDAFLQRLAGAR